MRCERESGSGVVGSSPERAGKRRGDGSGLSDTFASRKFPQATGELLALLRDSGLALETKEETQRNVSDMYATPKYWTVKLFTISRADLRTNTGSFL